MARYYKKPVELPASTTVDVVAIKGEEVIKKRMTLGEARVLKKRRGWSYTIYQAGFCTIKENKQKS